MKSYRLTVYFAISSIVIIAVATIVSSQIIGGVAEDNLTRSAEENSARDAAHIQAMMRGGNSMSAMPSMGSQQQDEMSFETVADKLPRTFSSLVEGLEIVKLDLIDVTGVAVWSTDGDTIGSDRSRSPLFQDAVSGNISSMLAKDQEVVDFDGVRQHTDIVETFIPVRGTPSGQVIGVLEVYRDVSGDLAVQVADMKSAVLRTAAGTMGVLFLTLFGFIVGANVAINRSRKRELSLVEDRLAERMQAEKALRKSEARNRALIDAIPDLMLRIRADGAILDYIVAEDSGGPALASDEYLGRDIHDVMPPEFADLAMGYVRRALDTGEGQTFEYQLPVPLRSSDVRDFEARVHISGDDEVFAIVRDITERRKVDRMKDEFISVVSHELRTPLTSMRGSLGLLAGGMLGALTEKGRQMLDIAVSNTDRLVRLINDILDIERMESGKVIMERKDCDAAFLVTEAADVMRKMAEEAGVALSATALTAQVHADPDRIIQTLTNLLSNAIKFSPRGGTVRLTAELQGEEVLFRVEDEGRGIPAGKLESIFERFQQVDASDSRKKGGTGLGLAICRSIVQQHGGKIWVESASDQGTTFVFTLPAVAETTKG